MKISVIIPYHIDRGYLSHAVGSAERQEGFRLGTDYEIIVQQGFHYSGKNLNDGVRKARGKYIKRLDEDDQLLPTCLKDSYEFMEASKCGVMCANAINFTKDSHEQSNSFIPATVAKLAEANTIHNATVMYLKEALLDSDETLWTGEDYELHLRMAAAGVCFEYWPESVVAYRIGTGQKSRPDDKEKYRSRLIYIEEVIRSKFRDNHTKIKRVWKSV